MSLDLSLGALFNAGSGALMVGLGVLVLRVRPRSMANVALAVFAIAFGFTWIPENLVNNDDPFGALWFATINVTLAVAAVALVALALRVPRPIGLRARPVLLAAAGAVATGAPALALHVVPEGGLDAFYLAQGTPELLGLRVAFRIAQTAFFIAASFALLLMALRWRAMRSSSGARDRARLGLTSAAVVLWPGLFIGAGTLSRVPALVVLGAGAATMLTISAALWLRNAAAARGAEARMARNLALLCLAVPLAGMAVVAVAGSYTSTFRFPHYGLTRLFGVALLAYAILRHQLLGIDLRVKWTIRQSTVAAAFVGVFFVVSELAQQFLATEGGLGPYLGIAAAGALVFAMAPLQRAAERVAEHAMPGVRAVEEMTSKDRARAYREASEAAWADGHLSRDERALLDRLRVALALSEQEAHRIEREAAAAR